MVLLQDLQSGSAVRRDHALRSVQGRSRILPHARFFAGHAGRI